jgi:NADH:ubiquinone oxidoreductase subunit F (NADH-binding)/NAD-dependent dihydropyrimidine dehydrogenase PreA subunit
MDRGILEGNPHSVIEGLMIAGFAIGSSEGYIYVRQEYPLAVEHLHHGLNVLRDLGLLGKNILGTGFDFEVFIHKGAGAFVSGESSALMSAIEGKVGEPRPKYIRTSISGLRQKPSCLNNVETMANVPLIIRKGADWYSSIGTETSKGTKIFSLVGKVCNTGLVEVPMGTPLRDIVYTIGGGIPDGKEFKAVQTGGPSGGMIPTLMLDLPVDFDQLAQAGSMMGSGGMIVMDEDTCMVDVARYFLEFLADESCGKCVPCREGISQLLVILNRISQGEGRDSDIALIEAIAPTMQEAALCGLGQSAPNPVLSSLKYFRDEYIAHIEEQHCPAGACKALINYWVDSEKCIGCSKCKKACPTGAITGEKKEAHYIDQELCTRCDTCYTACPKKVRAISKVSRKQLDLLIKESPKSMEASS